MDRPIRSSGAYNLNFIDWDNEFDHICNSNYNWNTDDNNCFFFHLEESPIDGMTIEIFNSIISAEYILDNQDEMKENTELAKNY